MHISEGILSGPVLLSGAVLTIGGLWFGIRRLTPEKTILCGVLAAVFFLATLIHIPIGPGNAHLILNGLLGILLGWAVFPSLLVALTLQAMLFQYGGFTTLGVNIATMAYSAVLARWVFYRLYAILPESCALPVASFTAGFLGVGFATLFAALALALSGDGFITPASLLLMAHLPVMIAEGLLTMLTIAVLARTNPEAAGLQLPSIQGKNA